MTLVDAYLAVGRVDRAKAAFEELKKKRARRVTHRDRQLRFGRARIAIAEKRRDDALRDVSTGVSIDEGFLTRGLAYAGRGDRDSAIVYFERFANMLEPNSIYTPLVLRKLGELYDAKGDCARALGWYRKFVGLWRNAGAGASTAGHRGQAPHRHAGGIGSEGAVAHSLRLRQRPQEVLGTPSPCVCPRGRRRSLLQSTNGVEMVDARDATPAVSA